MTRPSSKPSASRLTPRETECITLAALGLSCAETARRLNLAERTVEFHLQNAMRKLGASTKLRAVVLALEQRLIHPLPFSPPLRPAPPAGDEKDGPAPAARLRGQQAGSA